MRQASQKLWLGLVMVGLLSVGVVVHGEEQEPPQPSDFWSQGMTAGWLGSFIGGFVGYVGVYFIRS